MLKNGQHTFLTHRGVGGGPRPQCRPPVYATAVDCDTIAPLGDTNEECVLENVVVSCMFVLLTLTMTFCFERYIITLRPRH